MLRIFFNKYSHLLNQLFLLILLGVCIIQAAIVINDYALLYAKRIWRNRTLDAYGRSAVFLLGQQGAEFMDFIASHVPIDKTVIVAERSGPFSAQNLLQFYLLPRSIESCDCNRIGGKCFVCLRSSESYVPALQNFPPPGAIDSEKLFIPFTNRSGSKSDNYLGIYIPLGASQLSSDSGNTWNSLTFITTLLIDLTVLIGFGFLGFLLILLINPRINRLDALFLSIPAGSATLTWIMFLASWAGISISLQSIVTIYAVIIFFILLFSMLLGVHPFRSSKSDFIYTNIVKSRNIDLLRIISVLGVFVIAILATVISVGRAYSDFDDISIWSLKGYGIAHSGTIFAGNLLGGHGLAYPLSLPLSISIFKLASGDMLPGSKFLFPIYAVALLWGCYRFLRWTRVNNHIALIGLFLLISVPQFFYYTTVGYSNIPFTACLILGVLWGIEGLIEGNKRALLLGSVFFGFAGWIRPEGILFAGILIAVILIGQFTLAGKKVWSVGYWLLPGLIIPIVWLIFAHNDVLGDQAGSALTTMIYKLQTGQVVNIEALKSIAQYGINSFQNSKLWGFVLPICLIMFLVALTQIIRKSGPAVWHLFLATLAMFIIPAALFFVESVNEGDLSTFLSVSFERAYLPAVTLSLILAITGLYSKPRQVIDAEIKELVDRTDQQGE